MLAILAINTYKRWLRAKKGDATGCGATRGSLSGHGLSGPGRRAGAFRARDDRAGAAGGARSRLCAQSAGAGFAEHIHYHIVPRWQGDTNFMPVVADIKVMPEHLDIVYEKLKARLTAILERDA